MTIDEAIKYCIEVAGEQSRLYSLCPCPCDGTDNCMSLKNGKDMGCTKCAAYHRELAEWLTELKELKAADVQPVKHGRWIGNEVIQCSNCNFTMNGNAYGKLVYKYFKYCPNCGERMDGEQNE